jgi:hypothetical protein
MHGAASAQLRRQPGCTSNPIHTLPVMYLTKQTNQMDREIDAGRRKKSDKSKDKRAHNGKFSQKHVRIQQEMACNAGRQQAGCHS